MKDFKCVPKLNCWYYITILGNIWLCASNLPCRLGDGLYNTPTASLLKGKTPAMSIVDMTRNNLMLRFQWCCSFGECHCSRIQSGPIYRLDRTNCMLMLNWIVWSRTIWLNWIAWNVNIFTIELYLHLNYVFMISWIV